jgi:hypothetical protein
MKNLNKTLGVLGGLGIVGTMPEDAGAELKIVRLLDTNGIVRTRSAQYNPTWGELKTQFMESAYQALRGLHWIDDAGKSHLFTFDAANTHNQMKKALKIPDDADHLFVGGDMESIYNNIQLKGFARRYGIPGAPAAVAAAMIASEANANPYQSLYTPKEALKKKGVEEWEGGGLKDAFNPLEYLSPAKMGGGALNAAIDVGSRLLTE